MKLSEYNDMMSPEDLAREKMFNEFLIGIDDLINNADKYIEKTTSESKFQSVMPRSPFEKGLVKVSENPDVFEAVDVEPSASSVKEVSDNIIDVDFPKSVADSENPYFSSDEITGSETIETIENVETDNKYETELEKETVDIADTTPERDVDKHSAKKSPINKPAIMFAVIVVVLAILVSVAILIL